MVRSIPALVLPLALVACTASGTATVTPSAGGSSKPSPGASARPGASAAPATGGASTVTLKIAGADVPIGPGVKFTNTDVAGMRLRIGVVAGDMATTTKGEAAVSFLFGGGGKSMYPGWDVKPAGTVYSLEVYHLEANAGRSYRLSTDGPEATLEAADGHIKGSFKGTGKAPSGSASLPAIEAPIELTFDLVQPPL